MELHLNAEGPSLRQAEDFKRFKLVIARRDEPLAQVQEALAGIARLSDPDTAWVSREGLVRVAGRAQDAAWLAALQQMIDKARPHGWICETTGDIRSHVEWSAV